jgi:general stress protein YciG
MDQEKRKRGLATLTPERRRAIASLGGKSVPPDKRAFSVNAELAAAAGRAGGKAVDPGKRSFSRDVELAVRAGRKKKGADSPHQDGGEPHKEI